MGLPSPPTISPKPVTSPWALATPGAERTAASTCPLIGPRRAPGERWVAVAFRTITSVPW